MTHVSHVNHTPRYAAAATQTAATTGGGSTFSTILAASNGNESTGSTANSAAEPANSAAAEVVTTPAPPIPDGEKWYVRSTGRYAGGAMVYETPLGEIGRSPTYGNWFIRYGDSAEDGLSIAPTDETGNMVALATSNRTPTYQEVWNLFQQAGVTPAWGVETKQVPSALPASENAGFTDPQKALNKISEWRASGAMWEDGFQLPALSMAELPEGSDHPLLRELSQELRRVVADAPADQQGDMVALLQEQGYGEFLPGGRWFSPSTGKSSDDPFADQAALAVPDPWSPGVRWQDDPTDWRNQVASTDWADNRIPGPAQWGTRFVNPEGAANWIERALDTGAFWTGVNLPRYAPVTDPVTQQAVSTEMSWNLSADEATLQAAITRAMDEAPAARQEDLREVFVRQGFGAFLESAATPASEPPPPAAAAAPPASAAASASAAESAAATSSASASSSTAAPAAAAMAAPQTSETAAASAAESQESAAASTVIATSYDSIMAALQRLGSVRPDLAAKFSPTASLFAALAAQTQILDAAQSGFESAYQSYEAANRTLAAQSQG